MVPALAVICLLRRVSPELGWRGFPHRDVRRTGINLLLTRPRTRRDGDQSGWAALPALAGGSPPMGLKGRGSVPWSSRSAWVRR